VVAGRGADVLLAGESTGGRRRHEKKLGEKRKKSDRWVFNGIFKEYAVLQFSFTGLFCATNFSTRKHEFSELNSTFLVRVFTGSARDALTTYKCERRYHTTFFHLYYLSLV
jgi:hypothetical protein